MHLLHGILQFIILSFFLIQPIFTELIRLKDGRVSYEYDNSSKPLGSGAYSTVYSGIRIEDNQSEIVAFKELLEDMKEDEMLLEKRIYEMMGHHDSFPKFYHYFAETNETKSVLVIERFGRTLRDLWKEFRPFSSINVMKIGLQILDVLEWMHSRGFVHNDLHDNNVAVGYKNDSKIYLFDFNSASNNQSETMDLENLAHILDELTWINPYYRGNGCNKVLSEFSRITEQYHKIHDERLRKQTFTKLRKLLKTELIKNTNQCNYGELDIGCLQGAVCRMNLLRKFIRQNNTLGIKTLIQQGININAGFGDSLDYKPIHLAAELGNLNMVRFLIKHGAEINAKDNNVHHEMTPLHYAALYSRTDAVRVLIEYGAKINVKNCYGMTPLQYAEDEEVERILKEAKRKQS